MFRLSLDGPVARLVLDRPGARNAIPIRGWDELAARVEEAERAGARLLVLAGEGPVFCAGADLREFAAFQGDQAAAAAFRQAMRRGIDRLRGAGPITLAHVQGPCYGAGVALAAACDLRVAGPAARFAITPSRIGISFPQEDIARLTALVGPGQAARLLLAAVPVDGAEAARIGLVELHQPSAEGDGLPDGFLAALVAADPGSVAALKRGIALAARGVIHDREQDQDFDRLLASDAVARRLAERKAGRS